MKERIFTYISFVVEMIVVIILRLRILGGVLVMS